MRAECLVQDSECELAWLVRSISHEKAVLTDDRLRRKSGILDDHAPTHFGRPDDFRIDEPEASRK
jgi:hypothetical protein